MRGRREVRIRGSARVALGLGCVLMGACGAESPPPQVGYDAGPRPETDLGPWNEDAGPAVYPAPCGYQGVCPQGGQCVSHSVCVSTYSQCSVSVDGDVPYPSHNSDPCAFTTRPYDGETGGVTLPAELCVALSDPDSVESQTYAGIFDHGCRWADGSEVTGPLVPSGCYGVPAVFLGSWNQEWTSGWHFCGGPCDYNCGDLRYDESGGVDLITLVANGDGVCVGRSEERAFGVCAVSERRCSESNMGEVRSCSAGFFSGLLRDESTCSCMFTGDHPTGEGGAQGWAVPRTLCTRYRELFPDTVACRDASFAPVP